MLYMYMYIFFSVIYWVLVCAVSLVMVFMAFLTVDFVIRIKLFFVGVVYVLSAVNQEKREVELRSSIEHFPKGQLRHSVTEEKNPLPDAQSMALLFIHITGMH